MSFHSTLHPLQEQYDMILLIFEFVGPSPRDAITLALVCKDWMQVIQQQLPINLNLIYCSESSWEDLEMFFERINSLAVSSGKLGLILKKISNSAVSNLKKLKLSSCTQDVTVQISTLNNLENLTELKLIDSNILDEGGIGLVQCEMLHNLKILHLDYNELTESFAKSLSESRVMCNLECLSLDINRLGDEGLNHLSNSPTLTKLTSLSLARNNISHVGAHYISSSTNFTHLSHLNLNGNKLKDEGVFEISQIESLTSLFLDGNEITSIGILHLSQSPFLTNLKILHLRYVKFLDNHHKIKIENYYGSEVCEIISNSSSLQNLTRLNLLNETITPKGIKMLIDSNPKLGYLENYVRSVEISFYENKERGRTLADCSSTLMLKVECNEFEPPILHKFRVGFTTYPFEGEYEYIIYSENKDCCLQ